MSPSSSPDHRRGRAVGLVLQILVLGTLLAAAVLRLMTLGFDGTAFRYEAF